MSRARIVCSEILSRMSPIQQFDEKIYTNLNSSQEKIFNLCLNECTNGEIFIENNSEISREFPEMNTTVVDDWLRQKTMDCTYLNDENFLSSNKDPELCPSSDIGLELVLINNKSKETETNLSSDLDCNDPMLNLHVPMNDVLLRKTDTKCDNLSGKDLFSDSEIKNKCMWDDTLSITSRKSDCEVENTSDFSDFNLLSFSFDTNEHISPLDTLTTDSTKNSSSTFKLNAKDSPEMSIKSSCNDILDKDKIALNNQKLTNITKRPNILRTSKSVKSDSSNNDSSKINSSNSDNKQIDLTSKYSNDSDFIVMSNVLNNSLSINEPKQIEIVSDTMLLEQRRTMKKLHIAELSKIKGAVVIVNTINTDNLKSKTKVTIKTDTGEQNYEGNTAELMEPVGSARKNRKPNAPVDGEHIVTAVKTAAIIKQEKKQSSTSNKVTPEPEDCIVKEMLSVLGITDDMLYTILTNLGLRLWICPEMDCKRIFNRLNTLKCHILSHYGLKPFKCDFPGCPWSFYTSFKLKRHRETHLKKKDFVCTVPDCNRTFTTIYNLNTHLKLHERPARLKCLVRTCNFKFQTRRAMETHLKTHEISLAPYKCTHPGCNKLYFSYSALTAHMRCHQHKEEELRCQWENCGRLFDKPCRLKAHMRQHTGDKPYVCKYKDCKWAFASSSKLKRHQYKHNNERKFRCTIGDCNKAFMRSEHLREHTFTHIAQRTFQCTICDEVFSAKASLYVHKKKAHPNEKISKSKSSIASNFKTHIDVSTEDKTAAEHILSDATRLQHQHFNNNNNNNNNTLIITILPSEKTDSKKFSINNNNNNIQSLIIHNNGEDKCERNTNSTSINTMIASKVKQTQLNMNKSCARTYLPYIEKSATNKKNIKNNIYNINNPVNVNRENDSISNTDDTCTNTSSETVVIQNQCIESPTVTNITLPSDLLIGSEFLQNTQDTVLLSHFMLQDDVGTMDICNNDDGAEYILLLDSDANSTFLESTINLRDLD